MSFTNFYNLPIPKTRFSDCNLTNADFTEAKATAVHFENCILEGATFDRTDISKANFTTALHFTLNPATNSIKKAIFSKDNVSGLVQHHDIIIK